MVAYLETVILLNFLVDWFLLMGTNRLCGYKAASGRTAVAGAVGGLYGGVCLLPGFLFLANTFWHTVVLGLLALLAFGMHRSALRRGIVFLLLSMAVGGMASGLPKSGFWPVLLAAGTVYLLCVIGFRGKLRGVLYLPVELACGGKTVKLTALQDTGNLLKDPITGGPVLVVDGQTARELTGLSQEQLRQPLKTITQVPGLRLIPYHTVGTPGGMLLAMKLPKVKIGTWQGSRVVAFAPEKLSEDGEYQALTGGAA